MLASAVTPYVGAAARDRRLMVGDDRFTASGFRRVVAELQPVGGECSRARRVIDAIQCLER